MNDEEEEVPKKVSHYYCVISRSITTTSSPELAWTLNLLLLTTKAQLDSLIVTLSPGKGISPEDVKEIEIGWQGKNNLMESDFWAEQILDFTNEENAHDLNTDEEEAVVLGPSPWLVYIRAGEKAQQLDCNFSALTVEPIGGGMVQIHGVMDTRFVLRVELNWRVCPYGSIQLVGLDWIGFPRTM